MGMAQAVDFFKVFDVYDRMKRVARRRYSAREVQVMIVRSLAARAFFAVYDGKELVAFGMGWPTSNPFDKKRVPVPDEVGAYLYVEYAWSKAGGTVLLGLVRQALERYPQVKYLAFWKRGKSFRVHEVRRDEQSQGEVSGAGPDREGHRVGAEGDPGSSGAWRGGRGVQSGANGTLVGRAGARVDGAFRAALPGLADPTLGEGSSDGGSP